MNLNQVIVSQLDPKAFIKQYGKFLASHITAPAYSYLQSFGDVTVSVLTIEKKGKQSLSIHVKYNGPHELENMFGIDHDVTDRARALLTNEVLIESLGLHAFTVLLHDLGLEIGIGSKRNTFAVTFLMYDDIEELLVLRFIEAVRQEYSAYFVGWSIP